MANEPCEVCEYTSMMRESKGWGDGPWQQEPDYITFDHSGRTCIMHRNQLGGWCGYVSVAPGHPYYGMQPASMFAAERMLYVPYVNQFPRTRHINYASKCNGHVCHTPKPGEPDDVWWFGFDCIGSDDIVPAFMLMYSQRMLLNERAVYRDEEWVRQQLKDMAEAMTFAEKWEKWSGWQRKCMFTTSNWINSLLQRVYPSME
jgi:hypothetical protein